MEQSSEKTRRPPKHLSPSKMAMIRDELMDGKSVRQVARTLEVSIGTVGNIRKDIKENLPPSQHGPSPMIPKRTLSFVTRQYNDGKMKSLRKAQNYIREIDGVDVHVETVRRHVKRRTGRAYVKQKRCLMNMYHARARYQFAREHKNWTVDDWKRVMFSDETVISRVGSFGRQFYYSDKEHRRNLPHQIRRTEQGGGGKMMIWGCITYNSPGDLAWVPEGMDSELYERVLQDYVEASFDWSGMNPEESFFQHDNSGVHTANRIKAWLAKQKFTVLKWPAKSPDLNLTERVWSYVKQHLYKDEEDADDLDVLWDRIQKIWEELPPEYIHKLYEGMPKRIRAVLRSKGWQTKY